MPAFFLPVAAAEGIHPDAPHRPAVWIENGKAVCNEEDLRKYGPEGQALIQAEMDRLQREHDEQMVAALAKQPPAFIPPRTIAPASALERAARDLAKAGVALMAAGNSLKAALPDLTIEPDTERTPPNGDRDG